MHHLVRGQGAGSIVAVVQGVRPGSADFIECERAVGPREFRRNPGERLTGVRLGIGCARGAARLGDIVVLGAGAGCGFPGGCRIVDVCNDDGA